MKWSSAGRGAVALAVLGIAVGVGGYVLKNVVAPGDSIEGAIARLSSAWPATRRGAAAELAGATAEAGAVVPALTAALDDPDAGVREAALDALAGFGPASKPAGEKVRALLKSDEDAGNRRRAATLIGTIQDRDAVPSLMAALDDPDPAVRVEAVRSLGRFGRRGKDESTLPVPVDALIQALRASLAPDRPEDLRSAAVDALDSYSDGREAIVSAIAEAALKDESPQVRKKAVGLLRIEYPATAPTLAAAVEDGNPQVVLEATAKLAHVGMTDDRTVPALCRAAIRADERIREGVGMNIDLLILERPDNPLPPDSLTRRYEAAVEAFRKTLEEPSAAGRPAIVTVLSRIIATYEKSGTPALLAPAKSALAALIARIDDEREEPAFRLHAMNQWEMAKSFVKVRNVSGEVPRNDGLDWEGRWIEAMGRCLASGNAEIRAKAASVLRDSLVDAGGEPGLREAWHATTPRLLAALAIDDSAIRKEGPAILEALGPEAIDALPALRELAAKEKDADVRAAMERAVAAISGVEGLKAEKPEDRAAAVAALAKFGWRAGNLVPALIQAASDPDPKVRAAAATALGDLGKVSEASKQPLIDRLAAEPDPAVRSAILRGLAAFGPRDASVATAHAAALGDADAGVRETAAGFAGLPSDDAVVAALGKNLAAPDSAGRAAADALARMLFLNAGAASEIVRVLKAGPPGSEAAASALKARFAEVSSQQEIRRLRGDLPGLRAVLSQEIPMLVDAAKSISPGPDQAAVLSILARIAALAGESREQADREAVGPALDPFLQVLAAPASESEEDADVRDLAVATLGKAPTRRVEAARALAKELERVDDADARESVRNALAALAARAEGDADLLEALVPIVPAFTAMLDDEDPVVRSDGIRALGRLGEAARSSEPVLKTLAEKEPRPDVKAEAEAAVKAVQGIAKMPPPRPRTAGGDAMIAP